MVAISFIISSNKSLTYGNFIRKDFVRLHIPISILMDETSWVFGACFRNAILKIGCILESPEWLLKLPALRPHARTIQAECLGAKDPDITTSGSSPGDYICSHIWAPLFGDPIWLCLTAGLCTWLSFLSSGSSDRGTFCVCGCVYDGLCSFSDSNLISELPLGIRHNY
jgi:hypothetical protein